MVREKRRRRRRKFTSFLDAVLTNSSLSLALGDERKRERGKGRKSAAGEGLGIHQPSCQDPTEKRKDAVAYFLNSFRKQKAFMSLPYIFQFLPTGIKFFTLFYFFSFLSTTI